MSRIVIVGAGSAAFSKSLISDIVMTRELNGSTIALCDIDAEALDHTTRLAKRMVIEAEADITIESSTERLDVLPNADFVILTVSVGGKPAWEKDLDIPLKYGIIQPIGDSVGPGGLSRALRLLPVVLDICHDMEDLCPNALLLNYSNPKSCVCSAIHQYSNIRAVGLCHELNATHRELAKYLDAPYEETSVIAAGLNHFNWILNFDVQGQDGLILLRDKFDREGVPENMIVCASLFRIFGAFPIPGDRYVSEFIPWFLNQESDYGKKFGLYSMRDYGQNTEYWTDIIDHLDGYMRRSNESAIDIIVALQDGRSVSKSPESLRNEQRSFRTVKMFDAVNIPNYGLITNLPEGSIVEIPATISQFGIRGVSIGDLPHGIATMISQRLYQQHLIVEAAVNGDKALALQAMLLDPMIQSLEIAETMLDELLEAHEGYLPRFYDMGDG